MAEPVYKFWRNRFRNSWYELSEEEQNAHMARVEEALEKVGGKRIIICTPAWSNQEWLGCGVEEFPSVEAVQQHTQLLFDMGHFRYSEGESMLGVKWPPS